MTATAKQAITSIMEADEAATHTAAKHRDAPLVKATGVLAEIGDQPQMIATSIATAVIGLATRRPDLVRGGLRMLAAHLAATAVKSAIKHSVDRARPERALSDGETTFEPGRSHDHDMNSFPSGHTAGAVAVARAIARDVDGAATPAALVAGAIAAAQPANGKHYLSDLVAGAAVGLIAEAVVSAVFDHIAPRVEVALDKRADSMDLGDANAGGRGSPRSLPSACVPRRARR